MGNVNFTVLSSIAVDVYSNMSPEEQLRTIIDNYGNDEVLKEYYDYTKGDMNRAYIISNLRDPELAERLFKKTEYPVLKAKILPYVKNTELTDDFLLTYATDPDAAQAMVNKLDGDTAMLFLNAVKAMDISGSAAAQQAESRIKQNPITE